MRPSLILTKLRPPAPRVTWVPRAPLYRRLDEGLRLGQSVLLVAAPAGAGKTTLVAEWLAAARRPCVWLALDEEDNDPARFLAYLQAAVDANAPPGAGAPAQAATASPGIAAVIEQLGAFGRPLSLVLDDYHVIHQRAVHRMVAILLERLPPGVQLAVLTRSDPPLPLARWRARGQLTELRLDDLRFDAADAALLINRAAGVRLTPEQASVLTARTEGWAAGLQIAAASLCGVNDVAAFIETFTGRHRHILDFFVGEVLGRQPEAVRRFLLHTAVVDRLCAPLADALCAPPFGDGVSAGPMLDHLERANLFILPLDPQREWYRYHRLFADLLRGLLRQQHPERVAELERRASTWLAAQGWPEDAIDHALRAGDADRAAALIEACAATTLMRGETTLFSAWVEALPAQTLNAHPRLVAYQVWSLVWGGARWEALAPHVRWLSADGQRQPWGAPFNAFLAAVQGQGSVARHWAERALAELPDADGLLRNLAQTLLASAYLADGDTQAGMRALELASRDSERAGHPMLAVLALSGSADLRRRQGRLRECEALLRHALDLATDGRGRRFPIAGRVLVFQAEIARERNDLARAQALLDEGKRLSDPLSPLGSFSGHLVAAQLAVDRGESDAARQAIETARTLAEQSDYMRGDDQLAALAAARVAIATGDLVGARRWVRERGLDQPAPPTETESRDPFQGRLRKYEILVAARLWLAEGRPAEVVRALTPAAERLAGLDRNGLLIECLALRAVAYWQLGDAGAAQADLTRALDLAEPEGYCRTFLDLGHPLRALLTHTRPRIDQPRLAAYATRLLNHFGGSPSPSESVVELLSGREHDVLRLLATEASAHELAQHLSVSDNTLRTHLKNIYAKLGVHSRYEAVVRAKALGLCA